VNQSPSRILRALSWRPLPWGVAAALFALVVVWTFLATPRYRSQALLQVSQQRAAGLFSEALADVPGADLLGLGKDALETQIGLLRSRRVLDAVMDTLGLDVVIESPRADGQPLLMTYATRTEGPELRGTVLLIPEQRGTWRVEVLDLEPAAALPERIATGDTLRLGAQRIVVLPEAAERAPRGIRLAVLPRYATRRSMLSRLEVRRPSSGADLIALTYDDPDPRRAAAVLHRMLAEYLAFSNRAARGDAGTTVAELTRQLEVQQQRLARAEQAMRAFQERTGLILPAEQGAAQVKRFAALRGGLDALEVELNALDRLLALVEGRAANAADAGATYRQLATFPTLIASRAIQDVLLAILELENERSTLLSVRSETNADVRRLSRRIYELETELLRIGRQYRESLEEQIVPTRVALSAIDAELSLLPAQEMEYLSLLRDRTVLHEGFVALQQQLRLTEVQDALRLDDVRVVDPPEIADPDDPYFPRVAVHLVLALLLAAASGGAVALAREGLARGAGERAKVGSLEA
jgi:uncharacterized protein involved in exopolysaccharide biosynthesis